MVRSGRSPPSRSISAVTRFREGRLGRSGIGTWTQPLLADMAIHQFDLLRLVLGREPVWVEMQAVNPSPSGYRDPPAAFGLFSFEGDIAVSYRGSWISSGPPDAVGRRVAVWKAPTEPWNGRAAADGTVPDRLPSPHGGRRSPSGCAAAAAGARPGRLARRIRRGRPVRNRTRDLRSSQPADACPSARGDPIRDGASPGGDLGAHRGPSGGRSMTDPTRVLVWNEYRHELQDPDVAAIYPDGIHGTIAAALREAGLDVRTGHTRPAGAGPRRPRLGRRARLVGPHRARRGQRRERRSHPGSRPRRYGLRRPALGALQPTVQAPHGHQL